MRTVCGIKLACLHRHTPTDWRSRKRYGHHRECTYTLAVARTDSNLDNCDLHFRIRDVGDIRTRTSNCFSGSGLYLGLSIPLYRDNRRHSNSRDPTLYDTGRGEFVSTIVIVIVLMLHTTVLVLDR